MPSFKVVSVRFNEDEFREVEQAATSDHLKVSTWIKQALKEKIKAREGQGSTEKNVLSSDGKTAI